MLRAAIVGCGKIADAHASQIQRIPGSELVAVCDREELMAKQLADRFRIGRRFPDLGALLRETAPDVVHITTPPHSHYLLARQCLEQGASVYVEKPLTLHLAEAERLVELAGRRGLKLTVGHDYQFGHAARRLRHLVAAGHLGGPPVHMESHYCDALDPSGAYAKALLGDRHHWVRALPGKLLHNVISHGIARIAEFLPGDAPQVFAHGFVSPALRRHGEQELIDELRVTIIDGDAVTAYFTFSSQVRPSLNQFRVYGRAGGLLLDADNETLIRLAGARYKSFAHHVLSPLVLARQYLASSAGAVRALIASDFHTKAGMKHLIEAFYRSIADGSPPPIAYREILLTARIMDDIFAQIGAPLARDRARSA